MDRERRRLIGKIAVLAEEDVAPLFRLVGIKDSFVVGNVEEASKLILDLSRREEYKLIIVTSRIAQKLENLIANISTKQIYPLFVTIPDRTGPVARRIEPVRNLVRRAVGFDIKVK